MGKIFTTIIIASFHSSIATAQFTAQYTIHDALTGISMVADNTGDMNNDGFTDIVVYSDEENSAGYLINNGTGIYTQLEMGAAPSTDITDMAVGDITGDEFPEILFMANASPAIHWMRNTPSGLLGDAEILTGSATGIQFLHIADMDSDGINDVVYATAGEVRWMRSLGDGNFLPAVLASNPDGNITALNTGDADNDGDLDVIVGTETSVQLFINNGAQNWSTQVTLDSSPNAIDVHLADLSGDDQAEILYSNTESVWRINLGNNSFGTENFLEDVQVTGHIEPCDVDMDGDLDIVNTNYYSVSNCDYDCWVNNGSGVFAQNLSLMNINVQSTNFLLSDADGDGDPDLIPLSFFFGDEGVVFWKQNQGNGNIGTNSPWNSAYPFSHDADKIILADADDDSDLDIICSGPGRLYYHGNDGGGTYYQTPNSIIQTPYSGAGIELNIHLADIDGDGDLDVFYKRSDSGQLVFWRENLGTFLLGAEQFIGSSTTLQLHGMADTNFDGFTDILSVSSSADIHINHGDGSGGFTTSYSHHFGSAGEYYFDTADMDGDGDLDLFAKDHYFYPQNAWFEWDGSTYITHDVMIDGEWGMYNESSQAIADFDGDGDADISAFSDLNYGWCEQMADDNFTFNEQDTGLNVNSDYEGQNIPSDIDGNGTIDVLYYAPGFENVYWLNNFGGGVFGDFEQMENNLGNMQTILLADRDSDGDDDIFFLTEDGVLGLYTNYYDGSNSYYSITARVFYDGNENGSFDAGEMKTPNLIHVSPGNDMFLTNSSGYLGIGCSAGAYTVTVLDDPTGFWITPSVEFYEVTVDDGQPTAYVEFLMVPNPDIPPSIDGSVSSISTNVCGGPVNQTITVENTGTQIVGAMIEFVLHPLYTFDSATPAPDEINGDMLVWYIDEIDILSEAEIVVHYTGPGLVFLNEILYNYVNGYMLIDGYAPIFQFHDFFSQTVACSCDPNDIAEINWVLSEGYTEPEGELKYLVRFQNTGNAPAENVVVRDHLSQDMDWLSIEILEASHEYEAHIEPNGDLVMCFPDIMLPDSVNNEPESHGYFYYTINAKPGLANNTEILNSADIYFDYNPPVLTNTALNTIFDCALVDVLVVNDGIETMCICGDDDVELSVVHDQLLDYVWYVNDEETAEGVALTFNPAEYGVYSIRLDASNPLCMLSDTVIVIVAGEAPTGNILTDATSICEGEVATLTSDELGIVHWYINENLLQQSASLEVTTAGTYAMTIENACGAASNEIAIEVQPTPVANITSDNGLLICDDETLMLMSDNSSGNQWMHDGVVISDEQQITVEEGGNYSLIVTQGNCASEEVSHDILNDVTPQVEIVSPQGTLVCDENAIELNAISNSTFNWSLNDVGLGSTEILSVTDGGIYHLTSTTACGSASTEIEISAAVIPTLTEFEFDEYEYCDGETAQFTAESNLPVTWYTGGGFLSTENIISISANGIYDVVASNECGSVSDQFAVLFNPLPEMIITADDMLLTSSEATTYQWYDEEGIIPYATEQFFIVTESGNYQVAGTSDDGCVGLSEWTTVIVGVDEVADFGFRVYPNPASDLLQIQFTSAEEKSIVIYNSIGEVVQEIENINSKFLTITVREFPSGIYIIEVFENSGNRNRLKFVIE